MKKLLLIIGLFASLKISAQTVPTGVSIHTPELTAFNRTIETPVSLYSGVPNISIPIYTITMNGVSVPITLDYHAGGIRVDQEATWVGLGWALNYGGQISRVVRGTADENSFFSGNSIKNFMEMTGSDISYTRAESVNTAKYGGNDFMPDIFYYSALGYSGKFLFNQRQKKFLLFPKEDIAVQNLTNHWNLLLPEGTSIDFGKGTSEILPGNASTYFSSSFLITNIRNVYNDSITYNYLPRQYYINKMKDQSVLFNIDDINLDAPGTNYKLQPDASNDPTVFVTKYSYSYSQLSNITFPFGSVNFITGTRDDLPSGSMQPLVGIQVLDKQGNIVKNIKLNYDYFYGDANDILVNRNGLQYADNAIPSAQRYKRLKLTSMSMLDKSSAVVQNYSFDYYTYPTLPSKVSSSQDHYGYYNGIANNVNFPLIPKFIPQAANASFKGGDRRINPALSNAFSLKSITYPEGGKTEFIYENNDAQAAVIPKGLLNYYQDDNILNKSTEINITGGHRLISSINPDSVDAAGIRYFFKNFKIKYAGFLFDGYGWNCATNFGTAANEQQLTADNDNAKFALETFNGTQWINLQEFNSHPSNGVFNTASSDFLKLGSGPYGGPLYRLKVALTYKGYQAAQENQPYTLNFKINYRELDSTKMTILVGGLRVKDITNYLKNGEVASKKHYDYTDVTNAVIPNITSGKTISMPLYRQILKERKSNTTPGTGAGNYGITNKYKVLLSSRSSQPLETTSGANAGYEYVTENTVDIANPANNLKALSQFSFQTANFSQYYSYLNQGTFEPLEWTRGKLLSKKYYKGNNVIKSESYSYYDRSPHLDDTSQDDFVEEINTDLISHQYLLYPRLVMPVTTSTTDFVDYSNDYIQNGLFPYDSDRLQPLCDLGWYYGVDDYTLPNYPYMGAPYLYLCGAFRSYTRIPYFYHYTGFDKIKSKSTILYDGGNGIEIKENYFYDKTPLLHQLTSVKQLNSTGDTLETRYKYPIDSATVDVYSHMLTRHILNPVVETYNYKKGNFLQSLSSNYKIWTDTAVIMPIRQMSKIQANPAYATMVFQNYDQSGNLLNLSKANGIKLGYLWDNNKQYPVAEIKNVINSVANVTQNAIGNKPVSLYILPNSSSTQYTSSISFVQNTSGNITLQLPTGFPSTATVTFSYELTGPNSKSGSYSCSNGTCNVPSGGNIIWPNMPQGNYGLTLRANGSYASGALQVLITASYQTTSQSVIGNKEFYLENFEESVEYGVLTGLSHTGHRYKDGAYTVTWSAPNTRNYMISYWYRTGNVWTFKSEQPYNSSSLILTGGDAYDDIRIYPSDAQVTTYTYDPLVGMTSSIDPKGYTTYYEYDTFQRLLNIKDQNKNIIKNYQYNYAQPAAPVYWNDEQFGYFNKVCTVGVGTSVKYTVAAHTYSAASLSAANALAQADVTANGQANANAAPGATCQVLPYAILEQTSVTNNGNAQGYANYRIKLYTDDTFTTAYVATSKMSINYRVQTSTSINNGTPTVTSSDYTAFVDAGSSTSTLGQYENGCGAGGVSVVTQGTENQSAGTSAKGGAETNLLPPGGGTTCVTKTITIFSGIGYFDLVY